MKERSAPVKKLPVKKGKKTSGQPVTKYQELPAPAQVPETQAVVTLQEMATIAEKIGDTTLAGNYKKKIEDLLKLSAEN